MLARPKLLGRDLARRSVAGANHPHASGFRPSIVTETTESLGSRSSNHSPVSSSLSSFGSGVAFATAVGSLIEVPVLLAPVEVAVHFQGRFDRTGHETGRLGAGVLGDTTKDPTDD